MWIACAGKKKKENSRLSPRVQTGITYPPRATRRNTTLTRYKILKISRDIFFFFFPNDRSRSRSPRTTIKTTIKRYRLSFKQTKMYARVKCAPVRNVASANNNIFDGVIVARDYLSFFFFPRRYRLPAGLHLFLRCRSIFTWLRASSPALLVSRAGTRAQSIYLRDN